jgi:hypothetical protein
MNIMAGEWYKNTDIMGIVVASVISLLVGWLGAWAAFRSANPKLRLNWWAPVNSPLISPSYASSVISVTASGVHVVAPRVVQIQLANTGRRDIVSSMFHGGENMVFDLGVPIVALLGVESDPDGAAPNVHFPHSVGPNLFEVEPSHLARGQSVTVSVLVDGLEATPRLTRKPLVDVQVRDTSPGQTASTLMEALQQAVVLLVARR